MVHGRRVRTAESGSGPYAAHLRDHRVRVGRIGDKPKPYQIGLADGSKPVPQRNRRVTTISTERPRKNARLDQLAGVTARGGVRERRADFKHSVRVVERESGPSSRQRRALPAFQVEPPGPGLHGADIQTEAITLAFGSRDVGNLSAGYCHWVYAESLSTLQSGASKNRIAHRTDTMRRWPRRAIGATVHCPIGSREPFAFGQI